MKICIVTYGSLGDIRPYIALGKTLKNGGHNVAICCNHRFRVTVSQEGLEYLYMNDGFSQLIESAQGREAIQNLGSFLTAAKAVLSLIKQIGPLQSQTLFDAWESIEKFKPDVMIYNPKTHWVNHFAEKLKVSAVMTSLFPQFVSTSAYPSIGFPWFKSAGHYNVMTYKVALAMSNIIGRKYIKQWRTREGLDSAFGKIDLLHDYHGTPIPFIHGYSKYVSARPTDWPSSAQLSGFWHLSEPGWKAPRELINFLGEGEPPVYVGFGSMASSNVKKTTGIVLDALQQAGVRGILATGWNGINATQLPKSVFQIDYAPHDWLFPRMAAVVHHGGAGTTAAGLLAGCPTVICPFFGDQIFWGRCVEQLGVGVAQIPQAKLNRHNLSAAIVKLINTDSIKQKAAALGAQLQNENGMEAAVKLIEQQCN
jgi:sterol 3beta-glucosyltransferase